MAQLLKSTFPKPADELRAKFGMFSYKAIGGLIVLFVCFSN